MGSDRPAVSKHGPGGKLAPMRDTLAGSDPIPCEPDLDENGVDLAQIREMLDLTPAERMLVIENLADSIARIRKLNEPRAVR